MYALLPNVPDNDSAFMGKAKLQVYIHYSHKMKTQTLQVEKKEGVNEKKKSIKFVTCNKNTIHPEERISIPTLLMSRCEDFIKQALTNLNSDPH